MEGKLYLSLHDGIAAVSSEGTVFQHAPLEGALALCAGEESLFCADHGGAIWRLDRETLMPCSLSCGGPGICSMCLSPCGRRLYALLGEADSVLMSDAQSGRPIAVNRCGSNPKSLILCGECLAAAGGESACVHLFSADTLECIGEIGMPGPVYGVWLHRGVVYALCLSPDLNALLVAQRGNNRKVLRLEGMPGCLFVSGECILAAVRGRMHVISCRELRPLGVSCVPGRPGRILAGKEQIYAYDPLSECVFSSRNGCIWRRLCAGARDMCLA